MKRIRIFSSAVLLAVAFGCGSPESSSVNQDTEPTEEGFNSTKEDNTHNKTMEEKYSDSDADELRDTLHVN